MAPAGLSLCMRRRDNGACAPFFQQRGSNCEPVSRTFKANVNDRQRWFMLFGNHQCAFNGGGDTDNIKSLLNQPILDFHRKNEIVFYD
jgi:hypothetical protein